MKDWQEDELVYLEPIKPVYMTCCPNQDVILYEGEITCIHESQKNMNEFSGDGVIEYKWFPFPHASFKTIHRQMVPFRSDLSGKVSLKRPGLDSLLTGFVNNSSLSFSDSCECRLSGRLDGKVAIGTENDLSSIIFHVVNFPRISGSELTNRKTESKSSFSCGRLTLTSEDYVINSSDTFQRD